MIPGFKFTNTFRFREAAAHYEKHGCYTLSIKGTHSWKEFWKEEERRCLNGYEVNGVRITGYHYFYLNYCPIAIVETVNKNNKSTKRQAAIRKISFPSFWDVDWMYFTALDIAEYGLPGETLDERIAYYNKLPLELNLVLTDDNTGGGKHNLWLKPRGVGAPQPLTEQVVTPKGLSTIGDINIGDEIIDRQGNPCKVTNKYNQSIQEVWEVELLDGRKVRCGANHLWTVVTRQRGEKTETKDLTTEQLFSNGLTTPIKNGKKYKYKIPKIEAVKFLQKDLPIHPYILGTLLGDGDMLSKSIRLATNDLEIVERFSTILGSDYTLVPDSSNNNYLIRFNFPFREDVRDLYYNGNDKGKINPLKREIRKLNLEVGCKDKFIPEIYKYGSIEQRLELVKGLMDSDGSVTAKGYCEFSNTCKQLVDDLMFVLRSLGIYCSVSFSESRGEKCIIDSRGKSCTFIDKGHYRVFIATNQNIFYLPRKANRISYNKFTKQNTPIVNIVNTKVLEKQCCLEVDNKEHLYLTTDFVPTHNSWKGAALPARNFFFIRESKSYMFADNKEFIGKDGIYDKFLAYKDWINLNTPFLKYTDEINDKNKMHIKASHKDLHGNARGYKSEVMGVLVGGDSDKVRGKRGKVSLFEEFGAFVNADKCWEVCKSSMEEGFAVFGMMVAMGTGGTSGVAFESMEKMMFSPESHGLLEFWNIYDEDLLGTRCAFFTPAYLSVAFKDADGNTDQEAARVFYEGERTKKLKSPDPNDIARAKAEHPFTPREALLRTSNNIFPKSELLSWKTELIATNKVNNLAVFGNLEDTKEGVKFRPDPKAVPVLKYPHDKMFSKGCVTLYEAPIKIGGIIDPYLYIIVVDPYMHDSTSGDSLGAAYVIKNINQFSKPDDCIVASYVGRPDSIDEFNRIVRQLAEYYNGKIGFENNAGVSLIGYFKNNKKLHLLAEEFSLGFNENIPSSSTRRGYGMHIEKNRKKIGLAYFADWLRREWCITEDGEKLYNYHKIYDIGLLEELIKYNVDGNFDRVDAMVIGMFHQKEVEYKFSNKIGNKKKLDSFFTNVHFAQ